MLESSDRHAGVKLGNDDVSVKVEVDDKEFLQGTCTVVSTRHFADLRQEGPSQSDESELARLLNLETKWKDDQAELSCLRGLESAYISARNELVRL
jgi:hypothetical protein